VKAELLAGLGLEVEMIMGSGVIFEVRADGETVFSKAALYRFPEKGEVTALVRRKMEGQGS
jgi:hypothetical protein